MDQRVAFARLWVDEEGRGKKCVASAGEGDLDWIIHPSAHDRIETAAIRPASKDMGGGIGNCRKARAFVSLFCKCPLAPIDPAIGPEVGPVKIVGATSERFSLEP